MIRPAPPTATDDGAASDRLIDERPVAPDRPDAYAAIADLYDLEHGDFADDVEMYRQFAYASDGPVLELACGSGRIIAPLVADGRQVTGLDRSSAMLERARTALARIDGPTPRLVAAEMAAAASAPGGPFDLVIIGLNSLLHAETQAEQREILVAARNAATPDGQLIVDVLNPTPEHLQALAGTALDGQWERPDGGTVMKFSDRRVSSADQTIATSIWYDLTAPDRSLRRVPTGFTLRYLHHSELLLLLELAGWVDVETYGSYDLDPLTDTSDRLIVTAQRRPAGRSSVRVLD